MSLKGERHRVRLEKWSDKQVWAVEAARDRSQSLAFSVIVITYTSESTSAATFASSLHPAEEQPGKATVHTGIVAFLWFQKPAAFLHEECE